MFTLSPEGLGLLLQGPPASIARTVATALVAVSALAAAFGGFVRRPASLVERLLFGAAGLLLFSADPRLDLIGLALLATALVAHLARTRHNLLQA